MKQLPEFNKARELVVGDAMKFVFDQPGVSSMIVGTINPQHLRSSVEDINAVLS